MAGVNVSNDELRIAMEDFARLLREDLLPSEQDMTAMAVGAQKFFECKFELPACASCGIRALSSDRDAFVQHDVATLHRLKYTEAEVEVYQAMGSNQKLVKSVFSMRNTAPALPGERRAEFLFYHLHPELVTTTEEQSAQGRATRHHSRVTCWLCGSCSSVVNDRSTDPPPLSIAAGYDYGVLSRALPQEFTNTELSLTELRAISLNR